MNEADSLAEAFPNRISGVLKVRTMPTFAQHQILPWLPEFLDNYPSLSVDFELNAIYQDDFDRGVDIAIYGGILPSSSRIATRIGDSQWITCAAPSILKNMEYLIILMNYCSIGVFILIFQATGIIGILWKTMKVLLFL